MPILSLIAAAQQPCAIPPSLIRFSRPSALRQGAAVEAGRAVRVPLTHDPKLGIKPEKMPAPGTHGRAFRLNVTQAGRYRVAVDAPIWIELARSGQVRVASVAHGHAPPCSGVRKMVDFDLSTGSYTVQLSGAAKPVATLLIARL
jgi:hypothetical protein